MEIVDAGCRIFGEVVAGGNGMRGEGYRIGAMGR